jgi:hypothetical protein
MSSRGVVVLDADINDSLVSVLEVAAKHADPQPAIVWRPRRPCTGSTPTRPSPHRPRRPSRTRTTTPTGLQFFTAYGPWMAYFFFARSIVAGEPITLFRATRLHLHRRRRQGLPRSVSLIGRVIVYTIYLCHFLLTDCNRVHSPRTARGMAYFFARNIVAGEPITLFRVTRLHLHRRRRQGLPRSVSLIDRVIVYTIYLYSFLLTDYSRVHSPRTAYGMAYFFARSIVAGEPITLFRATRLHLYRRRRQGLP